MNSRSVSLDLTEQLGLLPQRAHDKMIMDILRQEFKKNDLHKINKVRLSLQLISLADITDNSGKNITKYN